jgi:hypothetical protein
MGKGFKHGGGGGSDLNFRVICGEKPASVKENTFWIDTEAIPGWQFSAYEPVEAPDGTVWIETADDADIGVNVLQKNVLMVHPVAAWKNVAGVYQPVAAEVFTGGAWVSFSTAAVYLYINGDTCDELTGGYVGWNISGGQIPSAVYGESSMVISAPKTNSAGTYRKATWTTSDKIDLSKVSEIVFEGAVEGIGIGTASLSVWSDRGATLDANRVANEALQNGSNSVSVDVSGLNGSYYVGFGFDASSVQITVTVDELRME